MQLACAESVVILAYCTYILCQVIAVVKPQRTRGPKEDGAAVHAHRQTYVDDLSHVCVFGCRRARIRVWIAVCGRRGASTCIKEGCNAEG